MYSLFLCLHSLELSLHAFWCMPKQIPSGWVIKPTELANDIESKSAYYPPRAHQSCTPIVGSAALSEGPASGAFLTETAKPA